MRVLGIAVLTLALVTIADAGDITGKISFSGTAPTQARLRMNADPVCMKAHKDPVLGEEVVVGKDGTVKNVFVYVKDGVSGKKFDVPKEKKLLDQVGCVYVPHALGLMVGQEVDIVNSDPTLHNVHTLSKDNPQFNRAQPMKGMRMTEKFMKPEMFRVKCEVHPWMGAYIGVFANPYFAVTGNDGSYTLKGLPAGDYTVEIWHEKYGTQQTKVKVGATDKVTADFTIKAK